MKIPQLRVIYYFIRPYPLQIAVITTLITLFAVLEGFSLGVLFRVLESTLATSPAGQGRGFLVNSLDGLIRHFPIGDKLVSACVLLIISVAVKNIVSYINVVLCARTGYRIWGDNQRRILEKYLQSDYQYFLDSKQGEIVYRIYTAPSYLGFILNAVPQIITELIKMVVIGMILFSLSFKISLAVLLFCPLYYLFTRHIALNISYHLGRGRVEASERENVLISEMSLGIRQIKLFISESRWIKEFAIAMKKYFNLALRDSRWLAVPKHLLDFMFMAGLAGILIAIKLTSPGNLAAMLPIMGIFAYAFLRIMPSLNVMSTHWIQVMGVLPNLETLHDLLEKNIRSVVDGPVVLERFREGIRFERVSFAYPQRPKVLAHISMEFKKGRQTAIIGPSGAGKTTIVDLMIRLFDPSEGRILVDGVDLKTLKMDSWRKKIGYVSQDTFIFHATIAENIAFGLDLPHEEIVRAVREANAQEFISRFPHGYETIVGDRGMKLSGGQRQRIAIARALVRRPEILILDEATSSLDSVSEAYVQEAINNISKNRTVIIIAHRLSTVRHADHILVLDNGKIVESGTHEQLLALNGKYRHYHHVQSQPAQARI